MAETSLAPSAAHTSENPSRARNRYPALCSRDEASASVIRIFTGSRRKEGT